MRTEIVKLEIANEMDLVIAHRRAMQICKYAGVMLSEQTRFATAVLEISRNSFEYCSEGNVCFNILKKDDRYVCEAVITDEGEGIENLAGILKRDPKNYRGRGVGIVFARKLVDSFNITTSSAGTKVTLIKDVPQNGKPINNLIIQGWIKHIKNEPSVTPYEELKNRTMQLTELSEELKEQKEKVEDSMLEIRNLNDKLTMSNSYMKEFTYTVSHDLKTPLTSLMLALGFLDESKNSIGEEEKVFIDIISKAGRRLERMIKSMLEILDLQSTNLQVAKKVVFSEILEDILQELVPQQKGLPIITDSNFAAVDEIMYVPAYISSVFNNIISNSIKYRVAERPLEISVKSKQQDGYVLLTFKDNAEGIDLQKNGARLFSPFTRFSSSKDGKGIGLYIIKSMIEKNGGKVEVDSTIGTGTTFRFYLKKYTNEINEI